MSKIDRGNKFKVWRSKQSPTTNILIDILLDVKALISFLFWTALFFGALVIIGILIYSSFTHS